MSNFNPNQQTNLNIIKSLKLSHFQLIKEIVQHGTLSKAAIAMAQTQSSTTKNLQHIESCLGVTLFQRKNRGLKLTQAGEEFLRYSRKILLEFNNTSQRISSLTTGTSGHISIGALITGTPELLPETLLAFQKEYPDVTVSIREGTNDTLYPELRTSELDLIVGRLTTPQFLPGIKQISLYDEPFQMVASASHPITRKQNLTIRDLSNYNWILPPQGSALRKELDHFFYSNDMELPKRYYESISLIINIKLLSEGSFIGTLPRKVYAAYSPYYNLALLPLNIKDISGPVGYSTQREDNPTVVTQLFIKYLRKVAGELSKEPRDKSMFLG
ncbi:MAG: hypothetical protein COA85_13355 [Robiginitomaculum sp.]|nr:MAG: hypothetical protein COA85_13355 [Robiginitomaculum sp.]